MKTISRDNKKSPKAPKAPVSDESLARGRAIQRARIEKGWSQTDLANEIGVKQPTISDLERGMSDKSGYWEDAEKSLGIHSSQTGHKIVDVPIAGSVKAVPVLAIIEEANGASVMSEIAIDSIPRPPSLSEASESYAFLMPNSDMFPVLRQGVLLIIHPKIPPRVEDLIVLYKRDSQEFIVREFIRANPVEWVIKKYGDDPEEGRLLRSEWPRCHVVWGTQRR